MEGDNLALQPLDSLFSAIGGKTIRLASKEQKALYHSATVMACNYLVTLQHSALTLLEQAGIEAATGMDMLAPIVHQTVDNIFCHGTKNSLTGPIARGDVSTIQSHLKAMTQQSPELLPLYTELARQTLPLAHEQGGAEKTHLKSIGELLKDL